MNLRAARLIGSVGLLWMTGCPVYSSSGAAGPCVGPECVCREDTECRAGRICNRDTFRCVEGVRCARHAACPAGEFCEGAIAQCMPGPRPCRADGDCERGEYCKASVCTPSRTCATDGECAQSELCDYRDTCVPRVPGKCRKSADCTSGLVCVEGYCRARADVCRFNYQCGEGRGCVNSACVPVCDKESDCGSGMTCVGSYCRPTPTCTGSEECEATAACVDGRCLPDCQVSGSCPSSLDTCAAEDKFCHPDWRPRATCHGDNECEPGHVCRLGACRTPCPSGTPVECRRYDNQLTVCGSDKLCYTRQEAAPECGVAEDCPANACIDAICR